MWLFDDYAFKNSIQRIDTNGNTLWKFTDTTIVFTSGGDSYSQLILEGSDLYAFGDHHIYKLNAHNGALIWRSAYYSNSSNVPAITHAFNYNSNNLLFIYNEASSINSIHVVRMDKSTGNMVDSVELYGYLPDVRLASDTLGNIFISTLDGYYKKLSAQNMHTVLFSDTIIATNNSPTNQISHLYVDSVNQLFTFYNTSTGIQINKRNPTNGDTLWQQFLPFNYTNPYLSLTFHQLKDVNGFLYVAYEQGGTGSGYWPLVIQKINKATGQVVWLSLIEPSGFDDEYDESSILSMDMDSHNDIYLSAYSGTGNYEGQFDVIKIDDLTGNEIFNNKIDLDSVPDKLSSGKAMAIINDVPYAMGILETNDKIDLTSPFLRRITVGFAKLNPLTGSVSLLKQFAGQSKYNARTVAIKKYTNNSLVALYQLGWDIAVAMYDVNLNNIWTRYLSYGDKLYGTDFCIQNEKIYVSTYHSHAFFSLESAKFGYYTLDMQGNLLSDTLFPVSTTTSSNAYDTSYTIKIYADSSNVYFSSYQSNVVPLSNKMHRSHNGLFAPPFNLYMGQYTTIDPLTLIDFDSTRIMGLGTTGPNTHHYKVVSMTKAALDTAFYPLPVLNNTIFINLFKASSSQVLISTRSTAINPIRESAGLLLYDLVTQDTIWSNLSDPDYITYTAAFVKAQTDNDSSIYAITTRGPKAEVKKINLSTGQTQWVSVFQDTINNIQYQFFDADYNPYYEKYVAAGQRKIITGTDTLADVFVVTFNKSGDIIDSFCLPGIKSKQNIATKVMQMGRGGNFVSGSYEDENGILQAFIMRIGNTIFASDSVWPGDTNQDGIVDYDDLFPIGVAFGNTGPARLNPSINWQPQYCNNWSDTLPVGINQKFVDSDGDGAITALDTTAIIQNLNRTHERSAHENPVVPGLPYLYIHFISDTLLPGQQVMADIMLGDSAVPATNVYAMAFKLSYNNLFIEENSFTYNLTNSWLCNLQNTITVSKTNNQTLHIAITNTDKQNKSGHGKIGELLFVIKDSVPLNFTKSLVSISELKAVNVDLNYVSINTIDHKFVIDNHVVASNNNIDFGVKCFLYPNPANTILHIYTENNLPDYINVFDISGKLLLSELMHNHIEIGLLEPGLYIAEVKVLGGIYRNRFVKQ